MKKHLQLEYNEYDQWRTQNVLPKDIEAQLEALLDHAYAPYSNYPVASVVVMANGERYVGTNQENAAFPSGLCAERVAVMAAKSARPDVAITAVYIMTAEKERSPAAPCGACRQVLHEMELRQECTYEVFLANKTAKLLHFKGIANLLPFSFTLPKKC